MNPQRLEAGDINGINVFEMTECNFYRQSLAKLLLCKFNGIQRRSRRARTHNMEMQINLLCLKLKHELGQSSSCKQDPACIAWVCFIGGKGGCCQDFMHTIEMNFDRIELKLVARVFSTQFEQSFPGKVDLPGFPDMIRAFVSNRQTTITVKFRRNLVHCFVHVEVTGIPKTGHPVIDQEADMVEEAFTQYFF